MSAQWTGELVGKMYRKITQSQLAEHMGITRGYVCAVLRGKREPAGAKERFGRAVDELIALREGAESAPGDRR